LAVDASFLIEIENLRYAYRKDRPEPVLRDIDLKIRPDEYLLICGASGSGKSTLCRIFNGLIPHFYGGRLEGEIRIAGVPAAAQSVGRLFTKLGMVFQNPETQLFNRSVFREIAFGLESIGLGRSEMEARIAAAAAQLGIEALLPRNPQELSGGEQQLVSLAAVLALKPQAVILDEPYANLDPLNVRRLRAALQEIHRSGTGVIVSEHRLALTAADAERMIVLHRGAIVRDGAPGRILSEDLVDFGLELPLAVRVGRRLGLVPPPFGVADLKSRSAGRAFPADPDSEPAAPLPARDAERILTLERISFRSVLHAAGFSLCRGECLALVGANGAGKTTLLKHANGLLRPALGEVTVRGRSARGRKVSELARYVGVAFQNPNSQFFKLTVREEIAVSARTLDRYDPAWLDELVHLFQLEPLLERAPYRLSEGEKKRVAFAAALAARPDVLALDEPTAGQDLFFRRALGRLLVALQQRGQAVLLVTQDLSFAEQYARRWLLMADGEIAAEGPPGEVMRNRIAMERSHLEPTDRFRIFGDPEGV